MEMDARVKGLFKPNESEHESEKDQRTIGRDQRKKFKFSLSRLLSQYWFTLCSARLFSFAVGDSAKNLQVIIFFLYLKSIQFNFAY